MIKNILTIFLILFAFSNCKKTKTEPSVENYHYNVPQTIMQDKQEVVSNEEYTTSLHNYLYTLPVPELFIYPDDIIVLDQVTNRTPYMDYKFYDKLYTDLVEGNELDVSANPFQDSIQSIAYYVKNTTIINRLINVLPTYSNKSTIKNKKSNEIYKESKVIPINDQQINMYDLKYDITKGFSATTTALKLILSKRNDPALNYLKIYNNNKLFFYSFITEESREELYFILKALHKTYNDLLNKPEIVSELYYSLYYDEYFNYYPTYSELNIKNPNGYDTTPISLKILDKNVRNQDSIINQSLDRIFLNKIDYSSVVYKHYNQWFYTFWIRRAVENHDYEVYQIINDMINHLETEELLNYWNKKTAQNHSSTNNLN